MTEILRPVNPSELPKRRLPRKRVSPKNATESERIGIIKGIIADGEINYHEAEFLLKWLKQNAGELDHWPHEPIMLWLERLLGDDHLDLEEQKELILAIKDEFHITSNATPGILSNHICFDELYSQIRITKHTFCLTGLFRAGPRRHLITLIEELGGLYCEDPSDEGCILIVGSLGYRDREISNKIKTGQILKAQGHNIKIIQEKLWWESVRTYFV